MKKRLVFALTLLASSLLFNMTNENPAFAVPKKGEISIQSSNGPSEGILSDRDGHWKANRGRVKDFLIVNNSNYNIKVKKIKFNNILLKDAKNKKYIDENSKEFTEFMEHCFIVLSKDGKVVFNGDLKNVFNNDGIYLDDLKVNNKDKEKMQLSFVVDKDAENELQNLQNEFSLSITYELAKKDDDNNGGSGGNNGSSGSGNNSNGGSIVGGNNSNMPNTGQLVGASVLGIMGVGVLSLGTFVLVKSKKKDGEKDE